MWVFENCRFNWGLTVRKKSDRILELLYNRTLFKEERNRARTVTKGIEGFGSFHVRTTDTEQTVLQDSSSSLRAFDKCNSQFNEHGNEEHTFPTTFNKRTKQGKLEEHNKYENEEMEGLISWDNKFSKVGNDSSSPRTSFKENMAPKMAIMEDFEDDWGDSVDNRNRNSRNSRISAAISRNDEQHPFNLTDHHMASVSLLSTTDRILQAC